MGGLAWAGAVVGRCAEGEAPCHSQPFYLVSAYFPLAVSLGIETPCHSRTPSRGCVTAGCIMKQAFRTRCSFVEIIPCENFTRK